MQLDFEEIRYIQIRRIPTVSHRNLLVWKSNCIGYTLSANIPITLVLIILGTAIPTESHNFQFSNIPEAHNSNEEEGKGRSANHPCERIKFSQ